MARPVLQLHLFVDVAVHSVVLHMHIYCVFYKGECWVVSYFMLVRQWRSVTFHVTWSPNFIHRETCEQSLLQQGHDTVQIRVDSEFHVGFSR